MSSQQLRVIASGDDRVPGLTVTPPMRRETPPQLQPGQATRLSVRIENASNRVDRYYLSCDLKQEWYRVVYPNQSDSLLLNPNRAGDIELILQPPPDATSDLVYSPTLRLSSRVEGEILTDIIYFKIARFYGDTGEGVRLEVRPQKPLKLPQSSPQIDAERLGPESPHSATVPLSLTVSSQNGRGKPPQKAKRGFIKGQNAKWGKFDLEAVNCSNTKRGVFVKTEFEREGICEQVFFDPELDRVVDYPPEVELLPGKSKTFQLWVKPKTWKSPLRRKEKTLNFSLQLANSQPYLDLPISESELKRSIVWKRSPWWIWFLLIASGLGLLGWFLIILLKLPALPQIRSFEIATDSESTHASTASQHGILLTWEIDRVQQLDSVLLSYQDTAGQTQERRLKFREEIPSKSSNTIIPRFLSKLFSSPPKKSEFSPPETCQIPEENSDQITCKLQLKDLQIAKDYTFELKAFPVAARTLFGVRQRNPELVADVRRTATVSFDAPQINNFNLAPDENNDSIETVNLTWNLSHREKVSRIEILMKDQQGKTQLYRHRQTRAGFESDAEAAKLTCDVPDRETSPSSSFVSNSPEVETATPPEVCMWTARSIFDPGIYSFEIAVFSHTSDREAVDRQTTQTTLALEEPRIQTFTTSQTTYVATEDEILANWEIDRPHRLQTLVVTQRSPQGSDRQDLLRLELPDNPNELSNTIGQSCTLNETNGTLKLLCEDFPIATLPIGEYIFELSAVPRYNGGTPLTAETSTVTVEPQRNARGGAGGTGGAAGGAAAGEDILFAEENFELKINDKAVGENPAPFLFAIGPKGAPTAIEIAWNVNVGGRDAKVELLPLIGEVNPSGSFQYVLREAPFQQTVTLQVTNELGEVATRVAVIQAYRSQGSTGSGEAEEGLESGISDGEKPTTPENLNPFEAPPQAD
ncbi:hypothetical protein [Baaleninema sp.]|uniref:COG1470 family protein n=1 Tax=Baaleninema sp. TaxID=3101197 RepID=UPI003D04F822